MRVITQTEIKEKMAFLVNKWKDKKPDPQTPQWWRYRADQSLYLKLSTKVKNAKRDDILEIARKMFE